jgi:large subunit ribosomal protein L4
VIFGPKPRDYSSAIPRKAKKEALRNSLFAKLRDGEVCMVTGFTLEKPSTREATGALKELGLEGKTLVLTKGLDDAVFRSFRNIRGVSILSVSDVNAEHLIRNKNVVFLNDAFEGIKERLGNG